MYRKCLHWMLTLALVFTMLPLYPGGTQAAPGGDTQGEPFVFTDLPTVVNKSRISFRGSLVGVNAKDSITYTVEKMPKAVVSDDDKPLQMRDRNNTGITVTADGREVIVTNLELFPGYNRIVFYGKSGAAEVKTVLPIIEYIDAPILYNLAIAGGPALKEDGVTVLTNEDASNASQGLFTITGNAPNAKEVIIDFGENESRSGTVREDGTDEFIVSQIKLKQGKNTLRFRVKNETQVIELTRDVVYYDGKVTFFDVQMSHSSASSTPNPFDLRLRSNFFVNDNTPANFTIDGRVIIPNDIVVDKSDMMRIESAYRVAGTETASQPANPAMHPDESDQIIVNFSAPVQSATSANLSTNQLKSLLDFQKEFPSGSGTYVSVNEGMQYATAKWSSRRVNGVDIPNSRLTIEVKKDNVVLADVSRLVLKQTIRSANDPNRQIIVEAVNEAITQGKTPQNVEWATGPITNFTVADGSRVTLAGVGTVTMRLNQVTPPGMTYDVPAATTTANSATLNFSSGAPVPLADITAGLEAAFEAIDAKKPVASKGIFTFAQTANSFTVTGPQNSSYNNTNMTLTNANIDGRTSIPPTTLGAAPSAEKNEIRVNSGIVLSTGVTTVLEETTPGSSTVQEVNTLTVTSGSEVNGRIELNFSDGTNSGTESVNVSAGDSAKDIAARIHSAITNGVAGPTDIDLSSDYSVSTQGNQVTITANANGNIPFALTVSDLDATFNIKFQDDKAVPPVPELVVPITVPQAGLTKSQLVDEIYSALGNGLLSFPGPGHDYKFTKLTDKIVVEKWNAPLPGSASNSDSNPTITIEGLRPYAKTVDLSGSFDRNSAYVTEAYVVGSTNTKNSSGPDEDEKIIIQFADDASTPNLPTADIATYDAGDLSTMMKIRKAGSGGAGVPLASGGLSAQYFAADKKIEITITDPAKFDWLLQDTRSSDGGVGAAPLEIVVNGIVGSPGSSTLLPITMSGSNAVRLGGTFDNDGVTGSPNPNLVNSDPKYARATFLNDALTKLGDETYFTLSKISGESYRDSDPYFIFQFSFRGDSVPSAANVFDFDKLRYVKLEAKNYKKLRQEGKPYEGTTDTDLGFVLIDRTQPYISEMKYNVTVSPDSPDRTDLFDPDSLIPISNLIDNTTINKIPFAVQLKIPNGNALPAGNITVTATSGAGVSKDFAVDPAYIMEQTDPNNPADRIVWFWVTKLPYDGLQTLEISYTAGGTTLKKSVTVTVISGMSVNFEGMTDGKVIEYDPTITSTSELSDKMVGEDLKDFKGILNNVSVTADDYSGSTQTIFLTLNNKEIPLKVDDTDPTSAYNPNKFILDETQLSREKVFEYISDGQNTIIFKYVKKDSKGNVLVNFEKTYIINVFANNYPELPKKGQDIFPYGTDKKNPVRDDRFPGSNGVYTTKEAEMNIYGTFDFIDLGKDEQSIRTKRNVKDDRFLLVIERSDSDEPIIWDLAKNEFSDDEGNTYSGSEVDDLTVTYKTSGEYFSFILENQKVPVDGNKVVYNIYVYNNGMGKSGASYRLEIGATGIPYKLLSPILPYQATMNQNYVEVILYAEGADSVTVNKVEAQKYDYDGNYDGDTDDEDYDYIGAFRAVVNDLKPNKKNKITFTITRGSDTVTDSFEVFYALANMPGAQFMETMKTSHKVFDGKLTLTFPKDTYLRRQDYNVPELLRTQLFKEHRILFAIANSKDGVVDRFDYLDPRPKGFDKKVEELGLRFNSSFDKHFVKASEVYWIDGGLADDPDTDGEFDPWTTGLLPHPLSGKLFYYDSVPSNRMLVPNKRGTLELAYDPNIVVGAGNNITVMRFDPENQYWENLGGQINASKRTIKVPFDKFGYYVVCKLNDSFQDVSRHQYARDHVEAMYSKGIIKPKRSNEFGVDDNTTRAEFTAMVVRALQLPLVEKPSEYSFDDVPTVIDQTMLWDYRYIETASRLGLIRGTNPRIFEPNARITREEAAIILARALQLKLDTVPAKIDKDLQKLFKDYNLIQPYSKASVLAIAKKKLIQGSPIDRNDPKKGYVFEPNANMLRGDAAILIARVMIDQKKIPPIGDVK